MTRNKIERREDIQVGTPLPRLAVQNAETGILATCSRCDWQGLFPDGQIAQSAVETHADRSHHGSKRCSLIALLDEGRAQCLEPDRGRLTAVQSQRPTFPRTLGDVSDLVDRGDLVELPPGRKQVVVDVSEQRALGLPTWSVQICDADADLTDDLDWRGLNELIARDGRAYCRYGETYLGAPAFEPLGTADHQADLSTFGSRSVATDGGTKD